ncbi:MATE family efflux transporter [Muricoccus pecuniae]|uniref:Multidrug-efflux transporter n=1 Tax=Muricoccus pecuniae TaxID=693023 RepID=A0A840Y5A9_9PROT|nr:MATE family efflux transporter [Roseomonas pecuniae]MBB5695000.1 MATE family multidrug resistance protein [Roseomonas pecuniae]
MIKASAPRGAWWAEARAMLLLAWPMALTNLSQMALLATDSAYLGHVSTEALAAVTLSSTVFWTMLAPGFGLSLATAALLAQERGGRIGHVRGMRRTHRAGVWGAVLAAVPGMVVMWNGGTVLRALGQDPALADAAQDFMRCVLWGIPFFGLYLNLRGFMAAMERPGPPLVIGLLAVPLNALIGWVLVFGNLGAPAMGVRGAGIAGAVADAFMFLALAVFVMRDRRLRRYRLFGRIWRLDPSRLGRVVALGLPIAAQMLLEIGLFSAVGLFMGAFGAHAVAAHAIALQIASTTFAVPLGLAQAATARVGLAIGAGRAREARRAGWTAIALSAVFMGPMAALMLLAPGALASIFLDPAAPGAAETAALAATLLLFAGLFQLSDGMQVVGAGALRGLQDTRVPMLIAAAGYWALGLTAALGLAFPAGLGPPGIWAGLVVGLAGVAGAMTWRWSRLSGRLPGRSPGQDGLTGAPAAAPIPG